jgi:hypothetical protein
METLTILSISEAANQLSVVAVWILVAFCAGFYGGKFYESAKYRNKREKEVRKPKRSILAEHYVADGYTLHHDDMDADMIRQFPECDCGRSPKYIGLKKGNSYVAITFCPGCGKEDEIW